MADISDGETDASGRRVLGRRQEIVNKHDEHVEKIEKQRKTLTRYDREVKRVTVVSPDTAAEVKNIKGPLKAKRGRKRKQVDSLENISPDEVAAGESLRKEKVNEKYDGLKIIDTESSEESDDEDGLNYKDITEFFVQTKKALEKGKVLSLKDIAADATCRNENLRSLLKGIPATVLDRMKVLSKLNPNQLHEIDKSFRKKDRLSVTEKFWKSFCEQHFSYGTSTKGKTYKELYVKSCRYFVNEARRVERDIKRRDEKLKKQMQEREKPAWEMEDDHIGSYEYMLNDDNYDEEAREIDYPEDSLDIWPQNSSIKMRDQPPLHVSPQFSSDTAANAFEDTSSNSKY